MRVSSVDINEIIAKIGQKICVEDSVDKWKLKTGVLYTFTDNSEKGMI